MAELITRNSIVNFLKTNATPERPVFDLFEFDLNLNRLIDSKQVKDKDFTAVFFAGSVTDPRSVFSEGSSGAFTEEGSFKLFIGTPKQILNGKNSYMRLLELSNFWSKKFRARRIEGIVITSYTTPDESSLEGFTKMSSFNTTTMTFNYRNDFQS